MAATSCAVPAPFLGTSVPNLWNPPVQRSFFGDLVIVTFLLAQCFDGVFTYIGVLTFGIGIEANPIISSLMAVLGFGPALAAAKIIASVLGICLHLRQIHGAIAVLSMFYLTAAIVPWTAILFF
jgi:hypothetical protein